MNKLIGADHEIEFWKGFIKSPRFLTGWVPEHKTPELREEVALFLCAVFDSREDRTKVKVLDVGSGVVSLLRGCVPGIDNNDQIIACDPLAKEYEKIFDYWENNIVPPIAFAAEDLPFENEFDIVHMSNAIDHSIDPVVAYNKLLAAVKPGGYLIVQGFFNEGSFEKWQGMHQWNIYVLDKEHLLVADKNAHSRVMAQAPYSVNFYDVNGKQWYVWIAQKEAV